ncbi:MAG TPA: MBG domain-containing protein, partial [Verrucomicrobiae bacterium]|nr:MBG domain-containing protein [Verrucomicrobiae bacterium]
TNAGNRILVASAPGLTSTNRAITVTPDVANSTISFVQGPAPTISAGTVFTNTVQIIDEFNNGVSNATITLSPNGFATLSGTVSRATAGNGLAIFNNLSVATPGSNYFITATSGSLSTNSSLFNVTVGAINHYLVTASSPQVRGTGFPVTVTALDAANNVVPDNSTVVNMSGSTVTVLFDGTGDNSYTNSSQVLSNGTFTINAQDTVAETITITASDATGKTGTSPAIVINAASGDYRTFQTGPWNTAATWQIWDGTNWDAATTPPAGGAGTNITILSTHRVTNNVAVALSGTLITQGSLTFNGGSIAVGSGGLVQNAGVITNSSASTLLFNAGATYQHAVNGPNIPNAAYNSNSLLRVTGITSTIVTLPTSISGSVEWNCPNQTAVAAIILSAATTIGGDFNVVSTGTGSIIDGGTTARNLTVGGNMNVRGGTYYAIGGNGSSAGNVTVSVANDLTVSGGNFSMVVGQGGTSSFNVSGTLIVGGDLTLAGGTLAILTNTTYASSGVSSMTVSGNTSIAGGLLNLTVATSGNAAGVTATLMGNLAISGGTINRGGTLPAIVNFASTSTVTYTKSGGVITGAVNFAILQGATVNFGTSLLDGSSGTFTLNAGGRIGLGDPNGITTSGQTGNIRVTGTRTYSTGARYVYNGSVPQDTGNGLPATVTSLTISNTAATVTLDASVNVTSNLTVSSGAFDMGAFTADRITSGGTITVANGSALKIGGTNTFPANYANLNLGTNSTVEYEGSGQSVASISYGNLNTSGTGTKTLLPGLAAITNLTIGAGTTLDAGTNSFSIAGNWSNNGSFTATNAQTVTFDGASPQTVDGSVATTFNNVEIDTGSVLDLAIDGSTAQFLSIGGVNQPTGTWGSSASAATHVDDVDFQGTGTLNVGSALTSPSTTTVVTSGSPSIYGQPVTFTASVAVLGGTPPATGTVTFMAGASTLGSQALSGSPTGTAAFVTGTLLPGTYTITAVYNGDANFLASSNSVAQEVDVAPLIITANSTAKTYGQTLSFGGTEFMTSGLTNGDTVTSVTLTSGGTLANASAGNYSIIPSAAIGTGLANYTITYSNGTLMVNQASVTGSITASNKVYDGTTVATIASYGLAGVFSNDTVTLGGGTANFIDKNVGTNKSVTATGLVLSGGDAGNYLLTSSNANTTADITAAALSISADNKTKTAGLPNPTLTATYVGFVGGDDTNSLSTQVTLSTTATDSSPAGTYTITASGAVAANYTISYNNGTLTVVGVPQITNTKVIGNQFIFSFPTVSNENYQVEFKTDLHAPTWTNSGGLIAGTGNTITVTNAITSSAVFYRVEVSPGN